MSPINLNRSKLVLTLLALGGCSQILGLGDYEVDPSLDEPGSGGESAGSGGESAGSGGKSTTGGKSSVIPSGAGEAGMAGDGQAGTAAEGGAGGVPGVPGDGGAAGDAQGGVPSDGGEAGVGGTGPDTGLVPCDSAACCTLAGGIATGVELLSDGSFELGTVLEGATPWTEDSSNGVPALTSSTSFGWDPHDGAYYAYLSGLPDEITTIWSEDVTIPNDAGWIEVSGYRLFQIDLQDAVNTDFASVGFYGYEETDIDEDPFYWTHPADPNSNGWGDAPDWTRFTASWSATSHQGKIRYLALSGSSDAYPTGGPMVTKASSYLFDSISLKVFRCYR